MLQVTLSAILLGLFLQALLIAVNLQLLKNAGVKARRGGVWLLLLVGLQALLPLIGMSRELMVTWWNQPFNNVNFALVSLALFAACALVAAWRSMAEVLAVRQMPWGWPALALLATAYLSGFAPSHRLATVGVVGIGTCGLLTYFALLSEPQPRPMWQRVVTRMTAGQWRAALLQLPRWPTTLLLSVPFSLLTSLALNQPDSTPWVTAQTMLAHPVSAVLLLVRDCALALFFAFSVKNRRAVASFLLLMVVLYGLLPLLAGATGSSFLLGLAQPWLATGGASLLAAAVHAAMALALLRWRWRSTAP